MRVILVSGISVADQRNLPSVEARSEGVEAGADDYLVKPVDLDTLVARVRAQLPSRAP